MNETNVISATEVQKSTGPVEDGARRGSVLEPVSRALSFRNISGVYVFAATFALFAIWVPETFLSADTWRALISQPSDDGDAGGGSGCCAFCRGVRPLIRGNARFRSDLRRLAPDRPLGSDRPRGRPVDPGGCADRAGQRAAHRQGPDRLLHRHPRHKLRPRRTIAWVSSSQQILGLSVVPGARRTTRSSAWRLPVYFMLGSAW